MSFSSHFADMAPPIPGPGEVLTLEQVAAADFSGVTPLGVLGYPIKHSVSPQMHNAALAVLAKSDPSLITILWRWLLRLLHLSSKPVPSRFANWRYYRIEVPPERLKEALDLLAAKGFVGLNLTIPHKVEVLKYVQQDLERGVVFPRDIGAYNTLIRVNPQWIGANTDIDGFTWSVRNRLHFTLHHSNVVLLGAGGVARAIACASMGSFGCDKLWIGNRTPERLSEFVEQIQLVARRTQFRGSIYPFSFSEIEKAKLPNTALVVNATSLGLKENDASPIDLSIFQKGTAVFDTTYAKGFRSAFLRQAENLGFPACDGVAMLFNQGEEALHLWVEASGGQMTKEAADAMFAAAYEATGVTNPRKPA